MSNDDRHRLEPTFQDPAVPLIALPTDFSSQRLNVTASVSGDGSGDVVNIEGPGCIRHIWFLWGGGLTLEITTDGAERPQVLAPLKPFFGVMQDRKAYYVNCSAFTVLPNWTAKAKDPKIRGNPGYNLWLPIPFSKSCVIRVRGPKGERIDGMIDWHKYQEDTVLTPYRFHAEYRRYQTTSARGQIDMANVSGRGFLAGFSTGYIQKNHRDMVFHTGGITVLLDGETDPHAIRGHNVEDDFGFTYGFNDHQTRWIGCPTHENRGRNDQDGVFYRFFGPDPIAFRSSVSFRAGCRGDDMETVVYYYKIPGSGSPEIETPSEWQVAGLLPCADSFDEFRKEGFIEQLTAGGWPEKLKLGDKTLSVRMLRSDHGWIDLRDLYYGKTDQSACARTAIQSKTARDAVLRISADDWCGVWLNGEHVTTLRHENGLETARLPVKLKKGANDLLLKMNNTGRPPNRELWAVNCVVEQEKEGRR